MPTDRTHLHSDLPDMSADLIAGRRFGQTWRGYDPDEVKQFLARVATQVRLLPRAYRGSRLGETGCRTSALRTLKWMRRL